MVVTLGTVLPPSIMQDTHAVKPCISYGIFLVGRNVYYCRLALSFVFLASEQPNSFLSAAYRTKTFIDLMKNPDSLKPGCRPGTVHKDRTRLKVRTFQTCCGHCLGMEFLR